MDVNYLLFLQNLREAIGPFWTEILLKITELGETAVLFPIIACIFWCGYKKLANRILYTICMGSTVNSFIKLTACVSRPWLRDPRVIPDSEAMVTATGYSFPSGHTAKAAGFFGTLAMEFKRYKSILIPCVTAIALVGFSRNYLGVHTPQDVVVSFIVSGVLIFVAGKALNWAEQSGRNSAVFALVSLTIGVLLIVYAVVKPYPATFADGSPTNIKAMANDSFKAVGTLTGFLSGWLLERKYIKFGLPQNKLWLIPRCAYGVAFMFFTEAGLNELLSHADMWVRGFTINFMNLLVITAVYPIIFKTAERMAKNIEREKI